MTNMAHFATLRDGIYANKENGYHFFDRDTLRFFGSRVHPRLYGDYFVTSEHNFDRTERHYTVRRFTDENGNVETVDGFQNYASYSGAHAAARRLAKEALKS